MLRLVTDVRTDPLNFKLQQEYNCKQDPSWMV